MFEIYNSLLVRVKYKINIIEKLEDNLQMQYVVMNLKYI